MKFRRSFRRCRSGSAKSRDLLYAERTDSICVRARAVLRSEACALPRCGQADRHGVLRTLLVAGLGMAPEILPETVGC